MDTIRVNGIQIYAHHGCMDEEAAIGGHYTVNVVIRANLSQAIYTDALSNTIDYETVYELVKKQMAVRSKLIEHVAGRIADTLLKGLSKIESVEVTVVKHKPPVGGDVDSASVTITADRKHG